MAIELGSPESLTLCTTAFTVGTVHTILGPDHYVPFAAMARAGAWSLPRTIAVTAATVGTMLIAVLALRSGASLVRLPRLDRFAHAFAGLAILACGVLVKAGLPLRPFATGLESMSTEYRLREARCHPCPTSGARGEP